MLLNIVELISVMQTIILSHCQITQCEIKTQFEICYWNHLTPTADKRHLNNESDICVGPVENSLLVQVSNHVL